MVSNAFERSINVPIELFVVGLNQKKCPPQVGVML